MSLNTLRKVSEEVTIKGQAFVITSVSTSPVNENLEVVYVRKAKGTKLWMYSRMKTRPNCHSVPVRMAGFSAI